MLCDDVTLRISALIHVSVCNNNKCIYGKIKKVRYGEKKSGETSTTLAETQSSVSSVGVQSKGSFIVFLVIKMSLFPASV